MKCKDVQSSIAEINLYCTGRPTGRALLVNAENYTIYQSIKAQLEVDSNKVCVYVSECTSANELPDLDEIPSQVAGDACYVLIGYSQASMLRGVDYLKQQLSVLLQLPVRGHTVILLDHCEMQLKECFSLHPDIQKRVLLVEGETSILPKIRLADNAETCIGFQPLPNTKQLLAYLENLTDEHLQNNSEISVVTQFSPRLFKKAAYSVSACDGIYEGLKKKYPEIAASTEKVFGCDDQWKYLAGLLTQYDTLSSVVDFVFGTSVNLPALLGKVVDEADDDKIWLHWLAMKVLGAKENKYLSLVLKKSNSAAEFEEHIYIDLLKFNHIDEDFKQVYTERKQLMEALPENLTLLDQYCSKAEIHQKNTVYYLTNLSEKEELLFMQCLSKYDYSIDELRQITAMTFPALNIYLNKFAFNVTNMKVPEADSALREIFTDYFERYKFQKVTNRIDPAFMERVEEIAIERPYNKIPARSTVISNLDKSNSQLYFFDALGVEYLAYIQKRCEHYRMIPEIYTVCCTLPSITSENKEFLKYFPNGPFDIKELDELKHHSQVIDYEQCKEPVHLLRELEIIDTELRKIQSRLKQGHFEKAIVVSDHGASRLAVIHEQENDQLELEEKGIHSGRCCPSKENPDIPYASYWNGFAVLANYDRFKGGRKANVEVHGGASLEEVVVPILVLTKKPTEIDICFVDPVITLKGREEAVITVFANIPLHEPKLVVNGKVYQGEFSGDSKHAKFTMPELKRTKDWTADFYDGDKKLALEMEFRVQKSTQEQTLFKKKPF